MADINIQRKKASPSPWLLIILAVAALAAAAYFFLRPDPADEPTPPANSSAAGVLPDTTATMVDSAAQHPADTIAGRTYRQSHNPAGPGGTALEDASTETAASLAAQANSDPAAPDYARNGLRKLTGVLVSLTDRDDLRDPTITEQRDNLTSATDRLGEPTASLRPGFVAAASLIRVMQQKAYPALENQATELTRLAGQLSGRSATAADQQQNKRFLTQAADAVRVLSEPAPTSLN